jgi:hypothetical protein
VLRQQEPYGVGMYTEREVVSQLLQAGSFGHHVQATEAGRFSPAPAQPPQRAQINVASAAPAEEGQSDEPVHNEVR